MVVLVRETDASGRLVATWSDAGRTAPPQPRARWWSPRWLASRALAAARAALLPANYPSSVSPDYAAFQFYDSLQGLCSYVRGTLASSAVLEGLGVGDASSSAATAAAAWLLRDTVGHITGLAFAAAAGGALDHGASG